MINSGYGQINESAFRATSGVLGMLKNMQEIRKNLMGSTWYTYVNNSDDDMFTMGSISKYEITEVYGDGTVEVSVSYNPYCNGKVSSSKRTISSTDISKMTSITNDEANNLAIADAKKMYADYVSDKSREIPIQAS